MIKKASEIFTRAVAWTYNNSYLTVCIVAILFFGSLMLFGCTTVDPRVPADTPVPVEYVIRITNTAEVFYTVTINKSSGWWQNVVVHAGDSEIVELEEGKYEVCLSKEFEVEFVICVEKNVTGADEWTIRKQ